jgi:hypothetical protein
MSCMFFFLSCDDFNPTESPIRNYRFIDVYLFSWRVRTGMYVIKSSEKTGLLEL